MYTIIYFSPTGNALHLANKVSNYFGHKVSQVLPLEFVDVDKLESDSHLILLYPVHGFNAPRTVKNFVKKLPVGIYDNISLLAVGSSTIWVNHAVSGDLRKELLRKNYNILIDEILEMPLTFVMSFPDDKVEDLIEKSEKKIENICSTIEQGYLSDYNPGIASLAFNFLGKGESFAARLFGLELHANNNCVSCGKCWENCPESNVKKSKSGKPKFGFDCLMCMRCIYNCPTHAIYSKNMQFCIINDGYNLKQIINHF